MALLPSIVIRQAYVRIGAYQGTPAQIAAAYVAGVSTLPTESFPEQSMRDMLVVVEEEIANTVAGNENNVLRSVLHNTRTVASGAEILKYADSANTAKIIGVYGQVRDAVSPFRPLTPGLHEDEIRAVSVNPGSMYKLDLYGYAIRPPRIYATRPNVIIDVCVYDFDARKTAIDADQALLFDQCEGGYFSGLMSSLKNEDPLLRELSGEYEGPYKEWLSSFSEGRPVAQEAAA